MCAGAALPKNGDREVRRVLTQAAWAYRHMPRVPRAKIDSYAAADNTVRAIAWKAQLRLTARYRRLIMRGKSPTVSITAIARELVAFIWEIALAAPMTP